MSHLFEDATPAEVKNAKIMLEELKAIYGTEWTTTVMFVGPNWDVSPTADLFIKQYHDEQAEGGLVFAS
ncbi:MAG: hypothetical protein Q9195_002390 [Heterodermia aff. obscurata]